MLHLDILEKQKTHCDTLTLFIAATNLILVHVLLSLLELHLLSNYVEIQVMRKCLELFHIIQRNCMWWAWY